MDKESQFFLRQNTSIQTNKKLTQKSKRRLQKTKAENTLKAYEADWRDFAFWCNNNHLDVLPAEPETIVNYLNDLADHAKANTVSRRLSAISENHIAAGFAEDNPTRSPLVKGAIEGIRREKGTMQRGKMPILAEDIADFSTLFAADDIIANRDKALLLLGFAGAFRRSELVSLRYEDLTFTREGLIILLAHSKGDQLGEGSYVAIPYNNDRSICAVTAVRNWLNVSQIKNGPLFRPFKKNKTLRDMQLSDKSVALIVKKYAELSGLDKKDFAGHSLRRGFATSAAQHDVDELSIMRQTRHKSEKMVRRYIEQGDMFKYNPLKKMFNQNRNNEPG